MTRINRLICAFNLYSFSQSTNKLILSKANSFQVSKNKKIGVYFALKICANQIFIRNKSDRSIFNKFVENLKQQAEKDKDLQSSLKQFEEKLTEVKKNKTFTTAKEIFNRTKVLFIWINFFLHPYRLTYLQEEVFEKNQEVIEQLSRRTKKIRDLSSAVPFWFCIIFGFYLDFKTHYCSF